MGGGGLIRALAPIVRCHSKFKQADIFRIIRSINQLREETASQGKNVQRAVSQGSKTDRSTLTPSSLSSVKVNYWKIAVGGSRDRSAVTDRSTLKPSSLASVKEKCWKMDFGQGVKVHSPGIFAINRLRRNQYRSKPTLIPIDGKDVRRRSFSP